ncbi:MAG: 23S rRNA (adenine(2030)-N(6))-methyltransferase RlmJ [Comamonadaceae bacterium]|nr:23S rRNA (adenine(2030)-N(6))-methyltransferase RlmJ [Comamonadaceae bacterium]
MFSYRHAFHAGNHADVLKHLTLIATLRHLMRKSAPFTLVDTHAGAGLYRLDGDAAQTSGEATEGVLPLLAAHGSRSPRPPARPDEPGPTDAATEDDALQDYLSMVASFNAAAGPFHIYPGSPFLMQRLMAEPARAAVRDRLRLFELHPSDSRALQANVAQLDAGRQISVQAQDGFEALPALLPPPAAPGGSRRALVLIDPSYEIKTDYTRTATAVQTALKRFATGVYLVWYPVIARPEAHGLPRRLKTLATQAQRPWLHATLSIGQPAADAAAALTRDKPRRMGLSASGMFVINPPHTLASRLRAALPTVLQTLKRGPGQGWHVEEGGGAR